MSSTFLGYLPPHSLHSRKAGGTFWKLFYEENLVGCRDGLNGCQSVHLLLSSLFCGQAQCPCRTQWGKESSVPHFHMEGNRDPGRRCRAGKEGGTGWWLCAQTGLLQALDCGGGSLGCFILGSCSQRLQGEQRSQRQIIGGWER